MTDRSSDVQCPRCGEATAGRFCSACGVSLRDVTCGACGQAAAPGARFCPDCGAGLSAADVAGATRRPERITTLIGGAALLVLVAFVAGIAAGRRSTADASVADQSSGASANVSLAGAPAAPDISTMSPEERASRLFNRVMRYSEQGKADSARFFAPMAIQAYAMIGPLDAHARYDIGTISVAVGDVRRARAEADTILASRPTHLLGLALAIKAAGLAGDSAAAARLSRRLAVAAPTERTAALAEYTEHARDIDEALKHMGAASR